MNGLKNLLSGKVKLACDEEYRERLICFFVENGIKAKITTEENGDLHAVISCRDAKNIAPALDKSGIIVYIINIYGLRRMISAYGKRFGFFAGILLFFILLKTSSVFLWKVDVSGTDTLSKERIRSELSEMGVRPGTIISEIDKSSVSDRFLSLHPEVSWASLNISGTTANLVLRETGTPDADTEVKPKLLVASDDAVIKEILVFDGKAAVSTGSVVKKGDVLISGYISGSGLQYSDSPVLRITEAAGTVTGEVEEKASVTVLLTEETEKENLCVISGYVVSVFGREIRFGKTDGEKTAGSEKYLSVFGGTEIPVTVKKYYSAVKVTETVKRTEEEAKAEAEKRLFEIISGNPEKRTLTYSEVSFSCDGNSVTASAVFRYEKNVAIPYTEKQGKTK